MIFSPENLIAHLSQVMTLEPGDVIFTGTPAGVGMGFNPPPWVQQGVVVHVEIEGLGGFANRVVNYAAERRRRGGPSGESVGNGSWRK